METTKKLEAEVTKTQTPQSQEISETDAAKIAGGGEAYTEEPDTSGV